MAIAIVFLISVILGSPVCSEDRCMYAVEEEDANRFHFYSYEDSLGNTYVENLTEPYIFTKPKLKHVTYYLYNQNNTNGYMKLKISRCKAKIPISPEYRRDKANFFIIHGFKNSYESPFSRRVKDTILKMHDVNVFVVDWSPVAQKPLALYRQVRKAVPYIGEYVGCFINSMINSYGVEPDAFKIIGHSLGAHIAGVAGDSVRGDIDSIVGLDPAGPLFSVTNSPDCLNINNANHVHVIHTNALTRCLPGTTVCNGLGLQSSIGHADYYPNGGEYQPGCSILHVSCSHSRAWEYYLESILTNNFVAQECWSYDDFQAGLCRTKETSYLPTIPLHKNAREGCYFLDTHENPPYAKGNSGIEVGRSAQESSDMYWNY